MAKNTFPWEDAMQMLDLRKTLKHLYNPSSKQPAFVEVPRFQFATVEGAIEPGMEPGTSPSFAAALEALYGISYTLKFMSKQRAQEPIDYPVMPLEALWWIEQGEFDIRKKDNWCWRAMIMQPEHIAPEMFGDALAKLRKKRDGGAGLELLRFAPFEEGLSVQLTHLGPYSEEPATLDRMRAFAEEQGYRLHNLHHEIYLGDPRRGTPEKLKTVLRHPVERAG
jgi:hypothetical protein